MFCAILFLYMLEMGFGVSLLKRLFNGLWMSQKRLWATQYIPKGDVNVKCKHTFETPYILYFVYTLYSSKHFLCPARSGQVGLLWHTPTVSDSAFTRAATGAVFVQFDKSLTLLWSLSGVCLHHISKFLLLHRFFFTNCIEHIVWSSVGSPKDCASSLRAISRSLDANSVCLKHSPVTLFFLLHFSNFCLFVCVHCALYSFSLVPKNKEFAFIILKKERKNSFSTVYKILILHYQSLQIYDMLRKLINFSIKGESKAWN